MRPASRQPSPWLLRAAAAALALLLLAANARFGSSLLAPAPPPKRFAPDPAYAPIARGEAPPSFGLNVVCWAAALAPEDEELAAFRAAYGAWRERAAQLMAGTGALIYPFDALHVTVATPAPSLFPGHHGWAPAERDGYRAAWDAALAAQPCRAARAPFPLVLRGLRLVGGGGAAILAWDDPTGAVAALRDCVRARAAELPRAARAQLAAAGFAAPAAGFVHSTVMRLALPRGEGVADADIEARWARAAAAFGEEVAARVELVTSRAATLVEGTELVNLASPRKLDFVLRVMPHGD